MSLYTSIRRAALSFDGVPILRPMERRLSAIQERMVVNDSQYDCIESKFDQILAIIILSE